METIRIKLITTAIIMSLYAVLSSSKRENMQNTGLFYVNPDGTMGDAVINGDCYGVGPICYQEFDLDTELPTGNFIIRGIRQP